MIEVVGVRFKGGTRTYYFNPNKKHFHKNSEVIVETKNGLELGIISVENKKVAESDIVLPLKSVIRQVSTDDQKQIAKNEKAEIKAKQVFLEKVEKEKLDIQLVDVHYNFEGTHVVFSYTADNRVDFRALVKTLAQVLRVRIEMRQINMREKARLIGGIGPCGYDLCCSTFLQDLHGSTIKMVKNQRLTLVPERISGLCGKLLCCLRYENDIYTELAEVLPDVNQMIETPDGIGKVVYLNVLNQKIDVLFTSDSGTHQKKQYDYEELKDSLEKANLKNHKKKTKDTDVVEKELKDLVDEDAPKKKSNKRKPNNFKKKQPKTKEAGLKENNKNIESSKKKTRSNNNRVEKNSNTTNKENKPRKQFKKKKPMNNKKEN